MASIKDHYPINVYRVTTATGDYSVYIIAHTAKQAAETAADRDERFVCTVNVEYMPPGEYKIGRIITKEIEYAPYSPIRFIRLLRNGRKKLVLQRKVAYKTHDGIKSVYREPKAFHQYPWKPVVRLGRM